MKDQQFQQGAEALDLPLVAQWRQRLVFCRGLSSVSIGAEIWQRELADCARVLVIVEQAVALAWPQLLSCLEQSLADKLASEIVILPGGEASKEDEQVLRACLQAIEKAGIDRHSAVICCGGGAFLDVVGFAAAIAHRGVRLVRVPSTSLAQADSAVGVKNGINAFGKKNFIGAFAVPYAVLIDFDLLQSLPRGERRAGFVEAVKVALIRDREFFTWLEAKAEDLSRCELAAEEELVRRSALLHAHHITQGGDPFESGSSRPLDFGHWAAHKLEQMSCYQLGHGQAVAVGLALDTLYSSKVGMLPKTEVQRVLDLLRKLGLKSWHPLLEERDENGKLQVFKGLEEFREHLGGQLTVAMLSGIGRSEDVHHLDKKLITECIEELKEPKGASKNLP